MSQRTAPPTVRDLMQTDVLTVTRGTTVAQFMRLLSRNGVSGAPVVDPDGSVAGVVSASDVMGLAEWPTTTLADPHRADQVIDGPLTPPGERGGFFAATNGVLSSLPPDRAPLLATTLVEEIMTPATFHVQPDATVPELARFLVRMNIHRALVLEGSRLAGIVTSMDVLRSVADGWAG